MDMRKNASGYYDETAYKAMTTEPKAGEIWTHNVSGAYMLIVANIGGGMYCPAHQRKPA